MRAQYVSGVLDAFFDWKLEFPYIIGVSAGISNAASFVSAQQGRNREIFTRFAGDSRYFSWFNLLLQGNPFGLNFIYSEIPVTHVPFDFDTFQKAPGRFVTGVTQCRTGQAVYFDKNDAPILDALRASASLPVIGRMAFIQGEPYLDGGIADPIPIRKALADGATRPIVILTRNRGFRKPYPTYFQRMLTRFRYFRFPALARAILAQPTLYNQTLDFLDQEEAAGRIFIIRPSTPLNVDRYSQCLDALEQLYQTGRTDALQCHDALMAYLGT